MITRNSKLINSILLVDDDEGLLDLYSNLLNQKLRTSVIPIRYPSVAYKLACNNVFDLILIDVTMNYNGTQFGGLDLYKSLIGKYGNSSLIAYSQFITDDLLKQYDYDFNFIEIGSSPIRFIDKLLTMIDKLRKRQSCFVAMPFASKYDQLFRAITVCVKQASFRCVRVDQEYFTKSIIEKVLTEIYNAKLLIFLATDQNPNAFYECGYAVALNKEIITLTDVYENLPFDIRDRNAIAYGEDFRKLKAELMNKLLNLTRVPLE